MRFSLTIWNRISITNLNKLLVENIDPIGYRENVKYATSSPHLILLLNKIVYPE